MIPQWEVEHLRRFDPRLILLMNDTTGCWEVWKMKTPKHDRPATWRQLQYWIYGQRIPDYLRIMELRGMNGEPADPGPWVLEMLYRFDTQRDPDCCDRYWAERKREVAKESAKAQEKITDDIAYHARGMQRDWQGQSPHGGTVQVPR